MNKVVIGSLLTVLVIGAVSFLLINDNTDSSVMTSTPADASNAQVVDSVETSDQAEQSEQSDQGAYVEYSDQALADSAGKDRVLFFHAEWCSTCKFFENSIKTTDIPSNIVVLEADFDKDTELKDKYGVTVQSTFVLLDANGEVVRTWPFASGLRSAQDLYNAVSEA